MSTSELAPAPVRPVMARLSAVLVMVVLACFCGGWPAPFAAAPTPAAAPVVKCLEASGDSRTPGAAVVVAGCDSSAAQHWTWAGSTLQINGLCLSAVNSMAELQLCGGEGEQWTDKGTELLAVQSGQCLTDPGSSTANGTPLALAACTGSAAQQWALPAPSSSAALVWGLVALAALL